MAFLSEKSQKTPSSVIREFVGMSYKHDSVLSFGFGQPDFVTPKHILEAAKASIDRGETFYAPNTGILPLREAISNEYTKRGLSYSPDDILVGAGAISVLLLGATAVLDIGDEMIISDPCYASYDSLAIQLGAVPVRVQVPRRKRVYARIRRKSVRPSPKEGCALNSPSNPRAAVASYDNQGAPPGTVHAKEDIYVITERDLPRSAVDRRTDMRASRSSRACGSGRSSSTDFPRRMP